MSTITTTDVTTNAGSDVFPVRDSAFYKAVETLVYQGIKAVKSTNPLVNAFYDYPVGDNGRVIEELIFELASEKAFVPTAEGAQPDLSPLDPKAHVKYWNNWERKQFKTTIRDEEIDRMLLRGKSPEDVASSIIETLTQGEGYADMVNECNMFVPANFTDAKTELGGAPLNMKGVLYAIREMASMVHQTNNLGGVPCKMSVDLDDIRIAVPSSVKSLIDFTELANVFNMSVEEIKGHFVELPLHAGGLVDENKIFVYDVHHLGRAVKYRKFGTDVFDTLMYRIYALNTEKIRLVNGLAKGLFLDVTEAVTAAKASIIGAGQ